jgi:hypothetical protein
MNTIPRNLLNDEAPTPGTIPQHEAIDVVISNIVHDISDKIDDLRRVNDELIRIRGMIAEITAALSKD